MGATGKGATGSAGGVTIGAAKEKEEESKYANVPTNDENDLEGVTDFNNDSYSGTDKWFANPKLSNYTEWENGLTDDERQASDYYTGSGYTGLNKQLYEKPWDEMSPSQKKKAADFYNAINKFELNKAIHVSRGTSIDYVFDNANSWDKDKNLNNIKKQLAENPYKQFNGFQSTSTGSKPAFSGSLVIHYTIPPSKGAGAYVRPISMHSGEREFTLNSNAVVRFDPESAHYVGNVLHINAEWVGQAKDQHFEAPIPKF